MLEPGDAAPEFTLTDSDGETVSLSDFEGPVVLYFYPRADTPGCTTEACSFRDSWGAFEGVSVLGVSNDPPGALAAFREKYDLPHTLLSDPEGEVASAYDSYGTVEIEGEEHEIALRNTYVVGADGTVEAAFEDVTPEGHAAEILGALGRPEP
jgi:peroxiredoxin Q/BCP